MDAKKKKRPRKKQPLIEWISDYLRYIMLIVVILVVVLVIVLIVKGVKGSKSADAASAVSSVSTTSEQSASEETGTSSVTDTAAALPSSTETSSTAETSNTAETSEQSDVSAAEQTDTSAEDPNAVDSYDTAHDKIYSSLSTFINGAAAMDVDTVRTVWMNMSADEEAAVVNGDYHSSYADLKVYLFNGAAENEYVVMFSFIYTDRSTGAVLPGLDTRYMVKDQDGVYKIASDEVTAANQALIDSVIASDDGIAISNATYGTE